MKGEQDVWTERRERRTKGRQQNAKKAAGRIIKGGRERAAFRASTTTGATAPPLHHGLERSIARRLTEERWRKRGEESEERTTEGQGDGWREQPSAWSPRENDKTRNERRV